MRLTSVVCTAPIAEIIVDFDYTLSQNLSLYTINISQRVTHGLARIQCSDTGSLSVETDTQLDQSSSSSFALRGAESVDREAAPLAFLGLDQEMSLFSTLEAIRRRR